MANSVWNIARNFFSTTTQTISHVFSTSLAGTQSTYAALIERTSIPSLNPALFGWDVKIQELRDLLDCEHKRRIKSCFHFFYHSDLKQQKYAALGELLAAKDFAELKRLAEKKIREKKVIAGFFHSRTKALLSAIIHEQKAYPPSTFITNTQIDVGKQKEYETMLNEGYEKRAEALHKAISIK